MLPGLLLLLLAQTAASAAREPVPAGTLRVLLVRHGQALSNLKPTGREPTRDLDHLTPLGRQQSRAVGEALKGVAAAVMTSPAGRARESAAEIAAAAGGLKVTVDERLRPMALGVSAAGAPLAYDARLADYAAGRDPTPRDGESFAGVAERVLAAARAARDAKAERAVVFVAHSEVIGSLVNALKPPAGARDLPPIGNGSISLLEIAADGSPTLLFVNHLPAELQAAPVP
jgi:probable phosphoglycerate mutase